MKRAARRRDTLFHWGQFSGCESDGFCDRFSPLDAFSADNSFVVQSTAMTT